MEKRKRLDDATSPHDVKFPRHAFHGAELVSYRKSPEAPTGRTISLIRPLENNKRQIRLLNILPINEYAPLCLQFNLLVTDLESAPDFKAISYTWGDIEPQQMVFVDDHPLLVRWNCFYAFVAGKIALPGDFCLDRLDLNRPGESGREKLSSANDGRDIQDCIACACLCWASC